MKKFTFIAALFALAVGAQAQAFGIEGLKAVGYDATLNQVTGRLAVGADALDLGVGFNFDNAAVAPNEKFTMSLSGFYVKTLNTWGPVSNNVAGGAVFALLDNGDAGITLYGVLQPEIKLLDRLILSTRFGLTLDAAPEFAFGTAGSGISIVEGLNFKVLF